MLEVISKAIRDLDNIRGDLLFPDPENNSKLPRIAEQHLLIAISTIAVAINELNLSFLTKE